MEIFLRKLKNQTEHICNTVLWKENIINIIEKQSKVSVNPHIDK